MTKELYDVLNKLKTNTNVTLNKQEIHLILKYIHDLEKELTGD